MFSKLFKRKKKIVSLETQIERIKEVGLSLNSGITISEVVQVVEREEIENEPYVFLLIALGGEIEISQNEWISVSYDVWYLDTECIEDQGIYVQILERLIKMTRGLLNLDNINDFVDIDNNIAWVSFNFENKSYKWDLLVEDDWFDMTLVQRLNRMLTEHEYEKKFAVAVLDQTCLIVFKSLEELKEIKGLTGLDFEVYH